jgi:insertion element IS1 protein InsB
VKKKGATLQAVHRSLVHPLEPHDVDGVISRVDEAEVDEMWSVVGKKPPPPWLWHAIDHHSGKGLAYVFGRRKDEVLVQLKALREPFGITRSYTEHWGAYPRHRVPEEHHPGKRNTQQSECTHLTLRTRIKRLVRKTIWFSKSIEMHDSVIGRCINRYECGLSIGDLEVQI